MEVITNYLFHLSFIFEIKFKDAFCKVHYSQLFLILYKHLNLSSKLFIKFREEFNIFDFINIILVLDSVCFKGDLKFK